MLGDLCEITLSLVGRNLWMIYNKAPFDPETIATTGNFYQGIDYFMMPSCATSDSTSDSNSKPNRYEKHMETASFHGPALG